MIRTLRALQSEDAGRSADLIDSVATTMTSTPEAVRAAVDYYADHRAAVDTRIAANEQAADELEASWRRQQEILAGPQR